MSVAAYDAKLTELGRFTPELYNTEEEKMYLFLQGMEPELQSHMRVVQFPTLVHMVERAFSVEEGLRLLKGAGQKRTSKVALEGQGSKGGGQKKQNTSQGGGQSGFYKDPKTQCRGCRKVHSIGYHCDGSPLKCHNFGKMGHRVSNCRSKSNRRSGYGQKSFQTSGQGSGQSAGVGYSAPKPPPQNQQQQQQYRKGKGAGSGEQMAPGRVFTVTQQEAETSPSVVRGTLVISSIPARVLFDSRATHSFASPSFLQSLSIPLTCMEKGLVVSLSVGDSVNLTH
ncbi:hypothetical protein Dimus_013274, partial [Dionaea muscipula]